VPAAAPAVWVLEGSHKVVACDAACRCTCLLQQQADNVRALVPGCFHWHLRCINSLCVATTSRECWSLFGRTVRVDSTWILIALLSTCWHSGLWQATNGCLL
jgi:hypothetical protein